MKKILLVLGVVFFIFGLVDFGGSYADFDLWRRIGIQLPEVIWKYSAYIEMAIGVVLLNLGKGATNQMINKANMGSIIVVV